MDQAVSIGVEYFYVLSGLLFKWSPIVNDYVIANFVPKGYVGAYNVLSVIVVVSLLVWFLRLAANKILVTAILIIAVPFILSSANSLFSGVPGVSSVTSKLDGFVRGIADTSSGSQSTVKTSK